MRLDEQEGLIRPQAASNSQEQGVAESPFSYCLIHSGPGSDAGGGGGQDGWFRFCRVGDRGNGHAHNLFLNIYQNTLINYYNTPKWLTFFSHAHTIPQQLNNGQGALPPDGQAQRRSRLKSGTVPQL